MKQILIDIGNTSIHVKGFEDKNFFELFRIPTTEACDTLYEKFDEIEFSEVNQVTFSSVVPSLDSDLIKYFNSKGIKISNIKTSPIFKQNDFAFNTESLGQDFIANFLAIKEKHNDAIIVSLGTATTFSYIKGGVFTGTIIAPGIKKSLESLISSAAKLQSADFEASNLTYGQNTIDAINIGAINSHWYMIEKNIELLSEDKNIKVIFTGGNARMIENFIIERKYEINDNLIFEGLNYAK
ncbi:type III pantothenate kinase [[Acholeplasma] multilocale]|uniref:type III pantothenate kinase n=1 Tax=[Acholeplasma] multilocale TaxID=264638 RepID=UPI000479E018|nr:type III pantothenate kinase [[Acholeplasma] multilocale]